MISHSLFAVEYLEHTFTLTVVSYPEIALKIQKGFHHDENSAMLNICKPEIQMESI